MLQIYCIEESKEVDDDPDTADDLVGINCATTAPQKRYLKRRAKGESSSTMQKRALRARQKKEILDVINFFLLIMDASMAWENGFC